MAIPVSSPPHPAVPTAQSASESARAPRLPVSLSSFVGREREVAAARQRLASTRLLTLTGAAGTGKTRLAVEVASREAPAFGGDVTFVELAPIEHGSLVAGTTLSAVGANEQPGRTHAEALAGFLRDRRALLVLDNCEHVIDASAALADALLRACPELRILATSREALGVAGETAWLVPPLSLPSSALRLEESEAVQLFLERARSVVPGFSLTPGNAPAVAQICRRLDGLPLALELAAARLRALPAERIAERLDDCFRLLASGHRTAVPRHQTLRAAIDWSYDLLSDRERLLLDRLSVFSGGFSLEAAETVCADVEIAPDEVLDLVASLVEKSLLALQDAGDEARYRLLEAVRQYAHEHLLKRGDPSALRTRHAAHFRDLVVGADPHLTGEHRKEWLARLTQDLDNIRSALAWSAEAEPTLNLRITGNLVSFWYSSGLWAEGRQWAAAALALPEAQTPSLARGFVLFADAALAALQGQMAHAAPMLEEAAALGKRFGDEKLEAYASNYVGMCYGQPADPRCLPPTNLALAWARRNGDWYAMRLSLLILGTYYQRKGDMPRALQYMTEGVEAARHCQERELGIALNCLGCAHLANGDVVQGGAIIRESLEAFRNDPQFMFVARSLELLGGLACESGQIEQGAAVIGAAAAIRETIGSTPFPSDREWLEKHVPAARAQDAAAWDRALARGRTMSLEDAIDFALREVTLPAASEQAPPRAEPAERPSDGASADAVAASERRPAEAARTGAVVAASALRVRALGPLDIQRDGVPLAATAWSYAKPRELLLFLLCHPEGRTREQVGLALWPDASSAQVRNNFHVTVHHLRKALGDTGWVQLDRGRYRIAPDRAVEFDAAAFEAAVTAVLRQARRHAMPIDALRTALDMYGGDFLAMESAGDWHLELRDRLRRLRDDALLALGDAQIQAERPMEAIDAFEELLRADELNEGAHRRLMIARARAGDRAAAMQQFQRLREVLRRELGAEPSRDTLAVYQRLQRGEAV